MTKVQNRYCWDTVKDWKEAQEMGFTKKSSFLKGSNREKLKAIVDMAGNNCFPLQIVCIIKDKDKYILADDLLDEFLCFINNEIPVLDNNKKEIFFHQLPKEKQKQILEAEVNSVWINMGQPKLGHSMPFF